MSSDTPAYYPGGWDRERLLNVGVNNEADSLTEDHWAVFREGLRADKGEQGFEEFFDEMWKREKAAKGTIWPASSSYRNIHLESLSSNSTNICSS
jgi:hypothetical protein